MITTVLFDLDGTLVHSAPGILAGFRKTFADLGVTPVQSIDEQVIGPPLRQTLMRLSGITDSLIIDQLATAFRSTYDAEGVLQADAYPGLEAVLGALESAGRRSFIVTNKRGVPARMIVERLGIVARLTGLYSLDMMADASARKRDLVARLLREHGLAASTAVLVGDTIDDADAAAANSIRFVAATYGYGVPQHPPAAPPAATLTRLSDLPATLESLD